MARYQAGLRTETRIIDATRQLLGELGLEGTTLKAICDRAGVRAGSFYNLFATKEEAVLRVVGESMRAVDPDPEGLGTETIADLVNAYVEFIRTQPLVAKIYLQIAISGALSDDAMRARVLRHHQRRITRYRDALRRHDPGLSEDAATEQAQIILATLNGLAFNWLLDPGFAYAEHMRVGIQYPVSSSQ